MNSVLVLLSTYNGECFLRQQLESIFAQKNVCYHILVRDDGSTDNTKLILKEYKEQYGKMTLLFEENIGAIRSFYALMQYAVTKMPKYDFYAFCDQDDVWFEEKLNIATCCLNLMPNMPKLFYSDVKKVDSNLISLNESSCIKTINNIYACIISNHILGCTQVFDYTLLEKASMIANNADYFLKEFKTLPYHDSWIARVAYAIGANVFYYKEPLIYYRQHANNVVGSERSWKNLMFKRIKRYIKGKSRDKSTYCMYLLKLYSKDMPKEQLLFIQTCAECNESVWKKIKLIFNRNIYQYGFFENFCLMMMIFFGKF